jgi:hypothetical protein
VEAANRGPGTADVAGPGTAEAASPGIADVAGPGMAKGGEAGTETADAAGGLFHHWQVVAPLAGRCTTGGFQQVIGATARQRCHMPGP